MHSSGKIIMSVVTEAAYSFRPWSYAKNLLIFAGILYPQPMGLRSDFFLAPFLAFFSFCLFSSAVYVANDIFDRDEDILHPRKSLRPLAQRRLSVRTAAACAAVAAGAGFLMLNRWAPEARLPAAGFLIINAAYSLGLRSAPWIDITAVAFGYVLRAVAGFQIIGRPCPGVFAAAILLAGVTAVACKRRAEMIDANTTRCRGVLKHYSEPVLRRLAICASALSWIFYTLYCWGGPAFGARTLVLSALFAGLFLIRYLFLAFTRGWGDEPGLMLRNDGPLMGLAFSYLAATLSGSFQAIE